MPDVDELATIARSRIGQVLRDKWQLDDLLGVGGMAAVYSATHRNGNRAAIKLLHKHIRVGSEAMSRFLREGRVANQVHHPGAVAVLDDDVDDDGAIFVVMELLEGETLGQLVERTEKGGGTVPLADLLRVADEVLDVLATAHENGVVHRDLKPDNVFVLEDGSAKILDFGIARLREATKGTSHTTAEGMLMGTPDYMPPEQARGEWDHVDGQSDLWAVGATMFSVLAHRPVHVSKTMSGQLVLSGTTGAPPLASVSEGVPEGVCALVDKALAFDKSERWPNARAMQAQVRVLREASVVPERRVATISARARLGDDFKPSEEPRKRNKAALLVLALGVIALVVFAWRSPQVRRLRGEAIDAPAIDGPAKTPVETAGALVATPDAGLAKTLDERPRPPVATSTQAATSSPQPTTPPRATTPSHGTKPNATPHATVPAKAWPSGVGITTSSPVTSAPPPSDPKPPDELFEERK